MKANMKMMQDKLLKEMVSELSVFFHVIASFCAASCLLYKTGSCFWVQAGLYVWFSHLSLQFYAQIIAMNHHTCLLFVFLWKFGETRFNLVT